MQELFVLWRRELKESFGLRYAYEVLFGARHLFCKPFMLLMYSFFAQNVNQNQIIWPTLPATSKSIF